MKEIQIVSVKEMREMDEVTLKEKNITSYELLQQAGNSIFEYITKKGLFSNEDKILVVSGVGNNGGDSLVVASILIEVKMNVEIVIVGHINKQSYENRCVLGMLISKNIKIHYISSDKDINVLNNHLKQSTLVIEGIFGVGLTREVQGYYKDVIELINKSNAKVISIDIPSGLNADNGLVEGICIEANHTLVIQNYKYGNLLNDSVDYSGKLHLLDIDLIQNTELENVELLKEDYLNNKIHKRKKNSHKYMYGNILTIGGSKGMMGAPLLSGYAALRTGSGLSSITYNEKYLSHINNAYPEIMVNTFKDFEELKKQIDRKSAIIFGPGIGRNDELNYEILRYLLSTDIPLVIDADGIYYLKDIIEYKNRGNIIITPHNKEMATLLDLEINKVIKNPIKYSIEVANKYKVTVVLKGNTTIITNDKKTYFSIYGNPGMATAGTGDVLSGIIGSFLGRGLNTLEASLMGVSLHSKAGKLAEEKLGEESMIASDLIKKISNVLKKYKS